MKSARPLLRNTLPLVLASASPRRQEFLRLLGLEFTVDPARIDESVRPGEGPEDFARRLARDKAAAVAHRHPASLVIGADTVVVADDRLLGKPGSAAQALAMLTMLQDRVHRVITGLALIARDRNIEIDDVQVTAVRFGQFSRSLLEAYVATGEPMDKAGAYGIQGIGGFLVKEINGSCSTVIGLPLERLTALLLECGAAVAAVTGSPA